MRSVRNGAGSAPGIGLASGAAIGVVLALLIGGSPTVAFGLIIGAALGLITGAAVQARRPPGTSPLASRTARSGGSSKHMTWRGAKSNTPLATYLP
jgi:hypothetical protein